MQSRYGYNYAWKYVASVAEQAAVYVENDQSLQQFDSNVFRFFNLIDGDCRQEANNFDAKTIDIRAGNPHSFIMDVSTEISLFAEFVSDKLLPQILTSGRLDALAGTAIGSSQRQCPALRPFLFPRWFLRL